MKATTSNEPFAGHVSPVTAVAFAGKRLVTGGELGTVRVHDAKSGAVLVSVDVHSGPVLAIAASADGDMLVTASNDGTICLVDATAGEILTTFTGADGKPSDACGALALSADGKRLISGSRDGGGASVWSMKDAKLRARLEATDRAEYEGAVAIDAGGDRVFVGRADGTVVVFDGSSHEPLATYETEARAGIDGIAVTPDGDELFVHRWPDGPIEVLEAMTGASRGTLGERGVRELALSADGTCVATGDRDGSVRVWDRAARTTRFEWSVHRASVLSLALRGDGRQLASGSDDGSACVWDLDRGELVTQAFGARAMIDSLAMTADGETLVSCGGGKKVRVWSYRSATLRFAVPDYALSYAISPDDRQLAVGIEHTVELYDLSSGKHVGSFAAHAAPQCIALLPDDDHVVSSGWEDIKIWSRRTGEVVATIPEGASAIVISPDGQTVITGTNGGAVHAWRYGEWSAPFRTFQNHKGTVSSLAITRDGATFVSGTGGGRLACQDLAADEPRWRVERGLQNVRDIVLSADESEVIVAGNANGSISAWDMATGKARGKKLKGSETSWVSGLARTPDGTQLISAGGDGAIRVWQLES